MCYSVLCLRTLLISLQFCFPCIKCWPTVYILILCGTGLELLTVAVKSGIVYGEKLNCFSCQIVCCNARSSFLYTSFIRNHIFLVKDEDIHCFSAHENAFFEKILKYYIWSSQCSSCSNEAKSFDFFLMKALSIVFLGLCRKTKIFLVKILLQEDNFWYLFAFWTVYCLKMTKIYSASQLIKMRKWENVNMYKLRLL